MKKEDVAGLVVWVLLAGLAAVFFVVVLRNYFPESQGFSGWLPYVGFFAGAMIGGIIINAALFELAHMLGAKIGGYIVTSVNILGFNFYKDEKKTKFRFSSYDGLTGETKIYPKANLKKEPNPTPYLLLSTAFFAVEIILVFFFFNLMKDSTEGDGWVKNFAYFILTFGLSGAIILVYNIIPLHLDNMTDGYRLRMVSSAKDRKAFNDILRAEGSLSEGVVGEETAAESTQVNSEGTNETLAADLNLNKVYVCLKKEDYASAEEILDSIIANENATKKVALRARAQKIFINLYIKDIEARTEYYEKQVPIVDRREIGDDNSLACIRAYLLMSGLMDKSKSECLIALNKVKKALAKTPDQRKELEIELFNKTINKICEEHPKWEFEKYLIK